MRCRSTMSIWSTVLLPYSFRFHHHRRRLRVRKDTERRQDRYLAIDPLTCAIVSGTWTTIRAELGGCSASSCPGTPTCSPMTQQAQAVESGLGPAQGQRPGARPVKLNIKGLQHYADPVPEVNQRAPAYLARLVQPAQHSRAGLRIPGTKESRYAQRVRRRRRRVVHGVMARGGPHPQQAPGLGRTLGAGRAPGQTRQKPLGRSASDFRPEQDCLQALRRSTVR